MLKVSAASGFGAGVAAAAGFPSISGERFRYVSDTGITKDGSNIVSAWADQSGNDDHLADPTANKPLWVDNLVNGYPAVRFDGVGGAGGGGDILQVAATAGGGSKSHIFAVMNQITWTNYDQLLSWGMAGYGQLLTQIGGSPNLSGNELSNNLVAPSLNTFHLIYTYFDGTTGSYIALDDASPVTGGASPTYPSAPTHFTLAGAKNLNNGGHVEIAEVVVYDGVKVIDDDLTALKDYFNTRYALY